MLFLAHVMGFYFISMVMMLRTSLPKEHRAMVTEILSHREFTNYQRWHDVLFVLSSLASVAFFGIEFRLRQRQEEDKRRWSD